jgi:hypothetical protein
MTPIRRIRRIRRIAVTLAGLAAALVALGATPAFAILLPPGPRSGHSLVTPAPPQIRTVTQTVVVGGTPGWQIALIAVGAALLAATLAVLADRARAARRPAATAAA